MNIFIKLLLVTLFTVSVQHVWRLIFKFNGYGNDVYKHYPGKCQVVKGFTTKGSEDMTLLPSGQLIITSGIASASKPGLSVGGAMYVMDTSNDTAPAVQLTIKGWPVGGNFTPHGVSHWLNEDKSVSIFVVLHKPERVGRFLYDGDKTLTLTKVYENSTYMRNLNGVVATGKDSFYVTNFFHSANGAWTKIMFETLLSIHWGTVVHVSDETYSFAADGLSMPNGIDADGGYVYLATQGAIRIFTRIADGALQPFKVIPISLGNVDNIKLDSSGNLWVGCRNFLMETFKHMGGDETVRCRSTIIRIRDPVGAGDIEAVFVDDASFIQAASVGVFTKHKLFIGSIIDKTLICDVNYLSDY